ncbi:hypothetical protein LTR37_010266 [Vermiconidia calcicola]|uniref:Uncharacterized protein n=1 Tax=Vermiconidia calcicola TaxID=1690605 RepID=A0ACC3N593_9PEZI|nr:hypothetical protein LTR37_010266 [Vermiconidia calcicola]
MATPNMAGQGEHKHHLDFTFGLNTVPYHSLVHTHFDPSHIVPRLHMYPAQKATLIRKLYRHYKLPTYASVVHHVRTNPQTTVLAYIRLAVLPCIDQLPTPDCLLLRHLV